MTLFESGGARCIDLVQHRPAGPAELIVAFGDLPLQSLGKVSPPLLWGEVGAEGDAQGAPALLATEDCAQRGRNGENVPQIQLL